MELKADKTTKILLGAIALGLFLNASNVFISSAYAYYNSYTQVVDMNAGDVKQLVEEVVIEHCR